MKGGLEMKVQGLKTRKAALAAEYKEGNQKGSLLLEAIVVLGMIATFTPMLYKHVADRRADIENINRANTLLYLQHKAEDYLKDPDNITALVTELGHNQHKEIYPSEMGAGDNFDGRYIVGIRREDEENKPVLKAMIIDTVHTGSDLRAAKVAELIGISAGIYTAVDPDAAWGINGIWSEPLSRYFDTTNIPTGAVAITTEYNKAKYRVNISDILVDADLDMGEFEVTAEQINAVAIAAENGTLDQLIAQDVRASNKVVAGKKLCVGGEEDENCIESWEGLGGKDDSDLRLVQECNAGMTESCMGAFARDLNTSCSKVDEVYDRFGAAYPSPKIYGLSYGNGTEYVGSIRAKCEGTQFVVDNISTSTLTNPVEQVGGSAFAITQPGWYQITLMGEAGTNAAATPTDIGAGGILIANGSLQEGAILILKGIKGYTYREGYWGGAGIGLWNTIATTTTPPLLSAGGGSSGVSAGGYAGSSCTNGQWPGYNWDGSAATTTIPYCSSLSCDLGATGGAWVPACRGGTGTGYTGINCPTGYTCTTVTGGNWVTNSANYPASTFGNWNADHSKALGYASIVYCGTSESDCPATCTSDSDCGYHEACDLHTARCAFTPYTPGEEVFGITNIGTMTCYTYDSTNHRCTNTTTGWQDTNANVLMTPSALETYTIPTNGKYKVEIKAEGGIDCSGTAGSCYAETVVGAGGIINVTKVYDANTRLMFKAIPGGNMSLHPNHQLGRGWGGAGIAMYENDSVKLVAGGGTTGGLGGGGGYVGGRCRRVVSDTEATWIMNGYSIDGTNTTYITTKCTSSSCPSGAYGGCYEEQWSAQGYTCRDCHWCYGGSSYIATDYASLGTFTPGGNSTKKPQGYSAASYGNRAPGTVTVTYCGSDASSTCP